MELIAPELVLYEVANALRFHKIYKLTVDDIVSAIRDVINLGITRKVTVENWLYAVKLSFSNKISIYDAVYGAMALVTNSILVTSDKELYTRIKDVVNVIMLNELSPP